jgi:predicted TIM-barrel fold metal-dependent hydrolase
MTIEQMVAAMDEAGVQRAAIVQASTCYGYDNSYVCDAVAPYPKRFTAVGCVDLLAPDATERIRYWIGLGMTGLRLFTGGSTAAFDSSWLDDPRLSPAWELAADLALPISVQTRAEGFPHLVNMLERHPQTRIILDHLARPRTDDGPPYAAADPLFRLARFRQLYLKVTPRNFVESRLGKAAPETFFGRVVAEFGSDRIAWGSNCPASEGTLAGNLVEGRRCLAFLPQADQDAIFGRTAQTLYPVLADR